MRFVMDFIQASLRRRPVSFESNVAEVERLPGVANLYGLANQPVLDAVNYPNHQTSSRGHASSPLGRGIGDCSVVLGDSLAAKRGIQEPQTSFHADEQRKDFMG